MTSDLTQFAMHFCQIISVEDGSKYIIYGCEDEIQDFVEGITKRRPGQYICGESFIAKAKWITNPKKFAKKFGDNTGLWDLYGEQIVHIVNGKWKVVAEMS
jgi:hypothetical protein